MEQSRSALHHLRFCLSALQTSTIVESPTCFCLATLLRPGTGALEGGSLAAIKRKIHVIFMALQPFPSYIE